MQSIDPNILRDMFVRYGLFDDDIVVAEIKHACVTRVCEHCGIEIETNTDFNVCSGCY